MPIDLSLNVLHVIGNLHPSSGGPSRTVTQLVDALSDYGNMSLLTQRAPGEPFIPPKRSSVNIQFLETYSRITRASGLLTRSYFSGLTIETTPRIIHLHGLWIPFNHWAAHFSHAHKIPLIIHPRGMLEPWALQHRSWRKRVALAVYQSADINHSHVLIATSEAEFNSIRCAGFNNPVAVIPNGINLALQSHSNIQIPRENVALFLSRIHPQKGLNNLLHAWSKVKNASWQLVIVGPDENGHLQDLIRLVKVLDLCDSVRFVGEVGDEEKIKFYDRARLFILPTLSENFGVVVAEALAHGVPVITTKAAPWAGLESNSCGWWVDVGVAPLIPALQQAMSMDDNTWLTMSERCRNYVQCFNWTDIAQKTHHVYQWALGLGEQPEFVYLD